MCLTGETGRVENTVFAAYGTDQRVHETLVPRWKSLCGYKANTRERGLDLSVSHSTTWRTTLISFECDT